MTIDLTHPLKKYGLILLGLALPATALADTDQDVLTQVLSGLIALLTSTPARLLFIIAIIGVGYATLALGRIPKEHAVAIVMGIGIIFSAAFIAQSMGLGV